MRSVIGPLTKASVMPTTWRNAMIRPAPMIACDVDMKFESSTEIVVPSTPSAANARPKNRMFSGVGVQRFSAGASCLRLRAHRRQQEGDRDRDEAQQAIETNI